ncbi:hypothetical protein GCM10022255_057020 [Dactylosporangium darangshiense]|uniref:Uncharacterized protein n=1 Tax=Dactylosporangium darangshiense TaxID=579108 RepID=A0ABP8DET8_9ACTN
MSHEIFRSVEFPFPGGRFPHHRGAVIRRTVLTGEEPAREVVHVEDNSWLVGDCVNDPNLPGAVVVARISPLADADPSLAELAALPLGHVAERADRDHQHPRVAGLGRMAAWPHHRRGPSRSASRSRPESGTSPSRATSEAPTLRAG